MYKHVELWNLKDEAQGLPKAELAEGIVGYCL
jgi:hypothetical protein